VLQPGIIEAGQPIEREAHPHPVWSIARAREVMQARLEGRVEARELAGLKALSPGWRTSLIRTGE
jgi:MOSC domain-containing protein YiiM